MALNTEVEMTEYDQVKDKARVAFITRKGNPMSMWIHRDTFIKLMVGPWDTDRMGDPTLYQKELKEACKKKIGGGYTAWFDDNANSLMKLKTDGSI